ncbi:MAG: ABC transporter substrate-binding protein [Promethearchaeota archaeon]
MRENDKKKKIAIIILAVVLGASGVGNIVLGAMLGRIEIGAPAAKTLVWGMGASPPYIDPVDSWDSQANVVIRQCTESLWWYDYRDSDLPLIRVLAEDEEWVSTTQLRVTVRQGVYFHDGTPFNADAVIWNLERLEYLCNHTGALVAGVQRRTKTASLYEFPDGSPIIDHFTKINDSVFDIFLTAPFSDFLDIYAYVCGNMLSPTAHTAQAQRFITLKETLVGTGPFIYESYVADTEVRFVKNENYNPPPVFRGPSRMPYFDVLIFNIISDRPTRNYAMLAGDIDWIQGADTDLYDVYRTDPLITFHESEIPYPSFCHLLINHKKINVTWRKAISYAVNYTYIVSDYFQDTVLRAYGPVSPAFGPYYKEGIETIAPYMNYTIARQTILDGLGTDVRLMGLTATEYGEDPINDANWEAANLEEFNYTYHTDNQWRTDLLPLLQLWFKRIGINVTDVPIYWWWNWPWRLNIDELELYLLGWGPDYHSPMNQIEPLMSNTSESNTAQVNDPQMEAWFDQWAITTNFTERVELIHNILEYIATVLYPYVWLYHPKVISIHAADLYNCAYNALGNFWAYPIIRNETWFPF